jgi:hypothetical protein
VGDKGTVVETREEVHKLSSSAPDNESERSRVRVRVRVIMIVTVTATASVRGRVRAMVIWYKFDGNTKVLEGL